MNTEKFPSPVTKKLMKTDNINKNYIAFRSVEMLLIFFSLFFVSEHQCLAKIDLSYSKPDL